MQNTKYSWEEFSQILMDKNPRSFFDNLLKNDQLQTTFPEIYLLKTALECRRWHPEGDAYEHTMLVLTQAVRHSLDLPSTFAALVHDFGKAVSPRKTLPKHYGHEIKGIPIVEAFADRIGAPLYIKNLAAKATRYHMYMHKLGQLNPKTVVKMFDDMQAIINPKTVDVLYNVGVVDTRGKLGSELAPIDHLYLLYDYFTAYKSVTFPKNYTSEQAKFTERVKEVKRVKNERI
jgi:tRNA nucleotidyltransferase (CCA-adding enzyme)